MAHAVLIVWRLCQGVLNSEKASSISLYQGRKSFWRQSSNWSTQQQTVRNLRLFLEQAKRDPSDDHNIAMVIYNELLVIYSEFHYEEFEWTALELLRRSHRRLQEGRTSGEIASWCRNANYELAWFYYNNGEIKRAIHHLEQVIPVSLDTPWEAEQLTLLQGWENEAVRA